MQTVRVIASLTLMELSVSIEERPKTKAAASGLWANANPGGLFRVAARTHKTSQNQQRKFGNGLHTETPGTPPASTGSRSPDLRIARGFCHSASRIPPPWLVGSQPWRTAKRAAARARPRVAAASAQRTCRIRGILAARL